MCASLRVPTRGNAAEGHGRAYQSIGRRENAEPVPTRNKGVISGFTPGPYANRSGEYEVLVDGTVWLIGGLDAGSADACKAPHCRPMPPWAERDH